MPRLAPIVIVWLATAPAAFGQEEPLESYYEGLRERRLFTIAESDCLRRLGAERISRTLTATLTTELSKTYAAHAIYSSGAERDELWERAGAVVAELLKRDPTIPHRALLIVQQAMVPAAQGTQWRWHVELYPLDEGARKRGEAALRAALERLAGAKELLEAESRDILSRPLGQRKLAMDLPPHRLRELTRQVDFQVATSRLDLAKVLPVGPDRTYALEQAREQFAMLTRIARPDHIAWSSRVAELEIFRLRNDWDQLRRKGQSVLSSDPPAEIRARAVAEMVRGQLGEEQPATALQTLQEYPGEYGRRTAELDALLIEALLAARRLAQSRSDEALADDLLQQAESVGSRLSGPWGTRSRLLLDRAREDEQYGPEIAQALQQARWAWQNGDSDAAAEWYGRAASQAREGRNPDLAAEFMMSAGSALLQAGRYDEAIAQFDDLLTRYPACEQAPRADLLRAYSLGKRYEQQPTSERQNAYRAALQTHRTRYAGRPTALEATWMLGLLEEHARKWSRALALFGEIPADHDRGPQARVRVAEVYAAILDRLRTREQPIAEWEQRAVGHLSQYVQSFPPPPARLSLSQATVAARLGEILLHRDPPDFETANRLLDRVLAAWEIEQREAGSRGSEVGGQRTEGGDQASESGTQAATPAGTSEVRPANSDLWQPLVLSASRLKVVSLAGSGQLEAARAALTELALSSPGQILDVLAGLGDVAGDIAPHRRRELGEIQLTLARQLDAQRHRLSEPDLLKLDDALAEAHAAAGQLKEAATIYERLLWQNPGDRRTLKALAGLYEQSGTPSDLRQAMGVWKKAEAAHPRGSLDWLEARYHMARCAHRLGETDAARKLIQVTRLLYPDLGTPSLKEKFEQLAAELE